MSGSSNRCEHKKRWILNGKYYTHKQENMLKMSPMAAYSSTEASAAHLISRIISQYVHASTCTITDGTACMGTNTIPFAHAFKRVNAVEIDALQCEDLNFNVRCMPGCHNVHVYNMDIISDHALRNLHHDVLYLSPPWGGVHYKDVDKNRLSLSGVRLADVCERWSGKSRFIALRLPINFDFAEFRQGKHSYREIFVGSIGYDGAGKACVRSGGISRACIMFIIILECQISKPR